MAVPTWLTALFLPAGEAGKCLGYWWERDLLATCAVENIRNAQRAFFHYGSIGVFQVDLSPLSCRSVLETCDAHPLVWK